jgi:hypothetical protein
MFGMNLMCKHSRVTFWRAVSARMRSQANKICSVVGVFLLISAKSLAQSSDVQKISAPTPAKICKADNEKNWVDVSSFAHLLLFYGRGQTDLPTFTSGNMMIEALTDEKVSIKAFGESPFVVTRNGLRYRLHDDAVFHSKVGEVHRDQVLATFAALNLPLNTPISVGSNTFSINDLLSECVANFNLNEREPAWTAMALTEYLPPQENWVNRFGETTSFSQLVKRLFDVDLNAQSCGGTHILEALIQIYNTDRIHPILDDSTRMKLNSYLKAIVTEIVQNQQADGHWNKDWCKAVNPDTGLEPTVETRLLVTGHLLQMLNELDPEFRPPNTVFTKGAQWITQTLNSSDVHYDVGWLCPFTHGVIMAHKIKF